MTALTNTPGVAHGPADAHVYRIVCEVCGQTGTLKLSIEPQTAAIAAAYRQPEQGEPSVSGEADGQEEE